jgi:hypothetical protein
MDGSLSAVKVRGAVSNSQWEFTLTAHHIPKPNAVLLPPTPTVAHPHEVACIESYGANYVAVGMQDSTVRMCKLIPGMDLHPHFLSLLLFICYPDATRRREAI